MSAPDPLVSAHLVLADGTVFAGEAGESVPRRAVASGGGWCTTGEVVFQTALSGYQEVLTDPSYAGQMVAFTNPHIGNYGTTPQDAESSAVHCRGVIVRDLSAEPSNWRSTEGLVPFLARQGVPAITEVDTRRLTRHLREAGALPGAFGTAPLDELREAARAAAPTDGQDLVSEVTTVDSYVRGSGPYRIVAFDFGIKSTILAHLESFATVTVVPSTTSADEVLAREPDGVFLSNGPGDPAALPREAATVAALLGKVPIFGICLGHQILATALGGNTTKLAFGHHGGNHPVRHIPSGRIEITSQNHNYAVGEVPGATITHVNLNDGVIEGYVHEGVNALSVQYHPEAGPGPHDARYLFEEFRSRIGVPRHAGAGAVGG